MRLFRRAGGTFGRISVLVRSVGGGEAWDSQVGLVPGRHNDTISQALGNRDLRRRALADQDYQVVDTTLIFQVGSIQQDETSACSSTLSTFSSPPLHSSALLPE